MITVFTPAYNRAHTIDRVFKSLLSQTYRDFEWIVVDDGSTDNTKEVVDSFIATNPDFQIRYFFQPNQGKHIATNRAVEVACGEFFVTLDSDDGCKSSALERLLEVWNSIPENERGMYKGVSCRCCTPEQPEKRIGTPLPSTPFDSHDLDLRYVYKVKGELWGMTRREVLLENPYPSISGLHYFPEGVHWSKIGLKYKTRYFDEPLRYYYVDGTAAENQLTKKVNAKETYYARAYMMSSEILRMYFARDPVNFFKQAVGLVRDGLLTGRSAGDIYRAAGKTKRGILLLIMAWVPGALLKEIESSKRKK